MLIVNRIKIYLKDPQVSHRFVLTKRLHKTGEKRGTHDLKLASFRVVKHHRARPINLRGAEVRKVFVVRAEAKRQYFREPKRLKVNENI